MFSVWRITCLVIGIILLAQAFLSFLRTEPHNKRARWHWIIYMVIIGIAAAIFFFIDPTNAGPGII